MARGRVTVRNQYQCTAAFDQGKGRQGVPGRFAQGIVREEEAAHIHGPDRGIVQLNEVRLKYCALRGQPFIDGDSAGVAGGGQCVGLCRCGQCHAPGFARLQTSQRTVGQLCAKVEAVYQHVVQEQVHLVSGTVQHEPVVQCDLVKGVRQQCLARAQHELIRYSGILRQADTLAGQGCRAVVVQFHE